jgi:anti-sigma factor RsiW
MDQQDIPAQHISGDEIDQYLLGQLENDKLEQAESHLLECEECRKKFQLTETFVQAFGSSRRRGPVKWPPVKS